MKTYYFLFFFIPIFSFSQQKFEEREILTQEISPESTIIPTESVFTAVQFEKQECISATQNLQMKYENEQNRKLILAKDPESFKNLKKLTAFINPFRPKTGFTDYGYHTLQNQVDHDSRPNGFLLDYNCGTRTYDLEFYNHMGTDYVLWPYPWKRMQENMMEVIAAAPGIIINKKTAFNDQNCLNNGNPQWNGIVIQHSDGSTATYMHFKKNSATSKEIGDTVAAGEFLGIAGSSGSSTIPHLHFEIQDAGGNLIDPYVGTCNATTTTTWWQTQENYYVPRINRLSTHYSVTQDSACPMIENTYEKTNFNNGDLLVLKLFYRDIKPGDITNIKITSPNGVVSSNFNWTQDWGVFYPTAYAYWTFNVTSSWLTGIYHVDITFGGATYSTIFGVRTALATTDQAQNNFSIYPNPVKDVLYIKNFQDLKSVEILDSSGRMVKKENAKNSSINVNNLPKGSYILKLQNNKQEEKTVKFIKE